MSMKKKNKKLDIPELLYFAEDTPQMLNVDNDEECAVYTTVKEVADNLILDDSNKCRIAVYKFVGFAEVTNSPTLVMEKK